MGKICVSPFHLEAKTGGKVFLVSDHHVDVLGDLLIYFLGFFLTADSFPKRGPVVEIVRDDHAVLASGGGGFNDKLGGAFTEGGKDPSGVKPTGSVLSENQIPIKIARLELGDGGVTAIGAADCSADSKAALSKV